MRRVPATVMGIIVMASCVPWLRHQRLFSVLVGLTIIALICFIVLSVVRSLAAWSEQNRQYTKWSQFEWWSPKLRKMLFGAAFVLVLMLTVPHFVATTSGAYKLAVSTAHASPRFIDAMGAPVTEAWFSDFEEVWGATSEMLIPVRGGMRRGDLRARAVKDGGRWRLTELTLCLEGHAEPIDLLSK